MNSAQEGRSRPTVIIPCYNRKAITLGCLSRLRQIGVFESFHIIVVDDASTDGTAEAIALDFPEVEVLRGHGELYWTGAVELGMRHAHAAGASSFIWINDDTEVAAGAIEAVTARAEETGGMISGQGKIVNPADGTTTYFPLYYRGTSRLRTVEVDFDREEIAVDSCRGNLVAISRRVVEVIGYPDGARIPHVAGDTDYGLRASKAGLPVRVLTGALVREICVVPSLEQSWLLGTRSLSWLWRSVFQKRNGFYPPMVLVYHYRHWGWAGLASALFRYAKLVAISCLRVFPRGLRMRWFDRHQTP